MRVKRLLIAALMSLASVAEAQGGTIGGGGTSGAAAAGTLTGTTLAAGVTASSLTSVTGFTFALGTLTGGASNLAITSGTGASRTLVLKTTTSGGTATNGLVIDNVQAVSISTGQLKVHNGSQVSAPDLAWCNGTCTTGIFDVVGVSVDTLSIANMGVTQMAIAGSGGLILPILPSEGSTKNAMCWDGTTHVVTQNAAATCTVSSARFKTNIRIFPVADAQRIVSKLHASSYSERQGGRMAIGIIAEQADTADWRLASRDTKGLVTSTNYEEITSVLLTVVKDQQRQLDSIKAAARKPSQAGFDGAALILMLGGVGCVVASLGRRKVA